MTHERKKIPAFATEAEEAKWWFDNQDMIERDFKAAAAAGTLRRGTAVRLMNEAASLALDPADISKARALAEKKGLQYQAYLKALLHEALEREEKLAS